MFIYHGPTYYTTSDGLGSSGGGLVLPPEVPDLPRGYLVREAIIGSIRALLDDHGVVSVQGMGGSGKTVTAAAVTFDRSLTSRFDAVVFLPFGQNPVLRDLQKTMHFQLTKKNLDAGLSSDEVLAALADAAFANAALTIFLHWCPRVHGRWG